MPHYQASSTVQAWYWRYDIVRKCPVQQSNKQAHRTKWSDCTETAYKLVGMLRSSSPHRTSQSHAVHAAFDLRAMEWDTYMLHCVYSQCMLWSLQ